MNLYKRWFWATSESGQNFQGYKLGFKWGTQLPCWLQLSLVISFFTHYIPLRKQSRVIYIQISCTVGFAFGFKKASGYGAKELKSARRFLQDFCLQIEAISWLTLLLFFKHAETRIWILVGWRIWPSAKTRGIYLDLRIYVWLVWGRKVFNFQDETLSLPYLTVLGYWTAVSYRISQLQEGVQSPLCYCIVALRVTWSQVLVFGTSSRAFKTAHYQSSKKEPELG